MSADPETTKLRLLYERASAELARLRQLCVDQGRHIMELSAQIDRRGCHDSADEPSAATPVILDDGPDPLVRCRGFPGIDDGLYRLRHVGAETFELWRVDEVNAREPTCKHPESQQYPVTAWRCDCGALVGEVNAENRGGE